jgi:hypothetical protein
VAGGTTGGGAARRIQAFTMSASGVVVLLPAGYDQAFGFAINNAGLVVGASMRDAAGRGSFRPTGETVSSTIWAPPRMRPTVPPINVSQGGWATGGIDLPNTQPSFVWTGAGTMQLNEPLPGYAGGWSHGINDSLLQVAGTSIRSDGSNIPTVWQCPAGFTTG